MVRFQVWKLIWKGLIKSNVLSKFKRSKWKKKISLSDNVGATAYMGSPGPKYASGKIAPNSKVAQKNVLYNVARLVLGQVRINFWLFFGQTHSQSHISESKGPRKRGICPNDSQEMYLQFKLLIHHLRWWIWGPDGPQSHKKMWKKSRLKKKLQTQISPPRWWVGILRCITKLLRKMLYNVA